MAELHGFSKCIPFCEVGLDDSSITRGGIMFSADKNCKTCMNILLILSQCDDLYLNILSHLCPLLSTSAHSV